MWLIKQKLDVSEANDFYLAEKSIKEICSDESAMFLKQLEDQYCLTNLKKVDSELALTFQIISKDTLTEFGKQLTI
jgi:hypothetical protein